MFKNYYGKTTIQQQQLVNISAGKQLVLLSIQICGGDQDGILTLTKYDNTNQTGTIAFQQQLTVLSKQPIVLQHKILIPSNYSFCFKGTVTGIQVCLNGVLQTIQSSKNVNILTSSSSDSIG